MQQQATQQHQPQQQMLQQQLQQQQQVHYHQFSHLQQRLQQQQGLPRQGQPASAIPPARCFPCHPAIVLECPADGCAVATGIGRSAVLLSSSCAAHCAGRMKGNRQGRLLTSRLQLHLLRCLLSSTHLLHSSPSLISTFIPVVDSMSVSHEAHLILQDLIQQGTLPRTGVSSGTGWWQQGCARRRAPCGTLAAVH